MNEGFCKGMNRGVQEARGELVLLLNQDLALHPDCFRELVAAFDNPPEDNLIVGSSSGDRPVIGVFPKVLFYSLPTFINAFGVEWYESCHWRDSRVGLPDLGGFDRPETVFGSIFPSSSVSPSTIPGCRRIRLGLLVLLRRFRCVLPMQYPRVSICHCTRRDHPAQVQSVIQRLDRPAMVPILVFTELSAGLPEKLRMEKSATTRHPDFPALSRERDPSRHENPEQTGMPDASPGCG